MNRAESALATARRLAEVAAEEKRLGRSVRRATDTCSEERVFETEAAGYVRTSHLTAYFRADKSTRYDRNGDPDTSDAEEAYGRMRDCPICWEAYTAVQLRKSLRARRGALRAALVRIGKLALEEANP